MLIAAPQVGNAQEATLAVVPVQAADISVSNRLDGKLDQAVEVWVNDHSAGAFDKIDYVDVAKPACDLWQSGAARTCMRAYQGP